MLSLLRRRHPDVVAVAGTGERTGLPDSCVDAVLYGQSWHWVEPWAAAAEASRILRPDGCLAMLFNDDDTDVGWVRSYQLAQRGLKQRPAVTRRLDRFLGPDFQFREERELRWIRVLAKSDLVDLVTTFSF